MKRSRIFMGMAALGFAAFGAFAFTSKSTATSAWYYNNSNICTPLDEVVPCNPNPLGGCFGEDGEAAGKQLYNTNCQIPLREETGF